MSRSSFNRLLNRYIIKVARSIVANSLIPEVSQRIMKASFRPTNIFNIYAIINILNENTNEFVSINMDLLRRSCGNNNVIGSEIAVCNTAKKKAAFVGDEIILERNTPTAMPQK